MLPLQKPQTFTAHSPLQPRTHITTCLHQVAEHLVTFLHALTARFGLTDNNSLLTDRTFLVKVGQNQHAQPVLANTCRFMSFLKLVGALVIEEMWP